MEDFYSSGFRIRISVIFYLLMEIFTSYEPSKVIEKTTIRERALSRLFVKILLSGLSRFLVPISNFSSEAKFKIL